MFLNTCIEKNLENTTKNVLTKRQNVSLVQLKGLADDNFILTQSVQFLFDKIENIVRKGE